jgi:hypothetical protein
MQHDRAGRSGRVSWTTALHIVLACVAPAVSPCRITAACSRAKRMRRDARRRSTFIVREVVDRFELRGDLVGGGDFLS